MTPKTKPRVELPEAAISVRLYKTYDAVVLHNPSAGDGDYYTADQMHAYAQAYADALARSGEVTDGMVEAAAKAIFFEETGCSLLDDDDPAHPGGYTVTYTRYARAALLAARAGESATKENQA